MPHPTDPPTLAVRAAAGKGRGVFALVRFAAGAVMEEAPVVVLDPAHSTLILRTDLGDMPFDWFDDREALVMGLGSFYNHSYAPNARYVRHRERLTMAFVALRDIAAGEEITINYNGAPDDRTPLWFAVADERPPSAPAGNTPGQSMPVRRIASPRMD